MSKHTNTRLKRIKSAPEQTTLSEKKSKITEISQQPFYIITTLIITLFGAFGGVSGFIQLKSYLYDAPKFKYYGNNLVVAPSLKDSQVIWYVLMSGEIANNGNKKLFIDPSGIALKAILANGDTIQATANLLPKDLTLKPDNKAIVYHNLNDLQRLTALEANSVISGSIGFYFIDPPHIIFEKGTKFSIELYDIYHTKYIDVFSVHPQQSTGINIIPRFNEKIYYDTSNFFSDSNKY